VSPLPISSLRSKNLTRHSILRESLNRDNLNSSLSKLEFNLSHSLSPRDLRLCRIKHHACLSLANINKLLYLKTSRWLTSSTSSPLRCSSNTTSKQWNSNSPCLYRPLPSPETKLIWLLISDTMSKQVMIDSRRPPLLLPSSLSGRDRKRDQRPLCSLASLVHLAQLLQSSL